MDMCFTKVCISFSKGCPTLGILGNLFYHIVFILSKCSAKLSMKDETAMISLMFKFLRCPLTFGPLFTKR